MVSSARAFAWRGALWPFNRRLELWLHSGRAVPQTTAVPGERRDGAARSNFTNLRNTNASRLAVGHQIASVPHAEAEEGASTATAR